ncbi:MAG: phosphoribosylglycinamide formyltransferase [Acidobacteria bacterium]|nr:phosphoribosylglycinamide formyltransferase [Acidobacteriota bacterium]MBV9144714.1 phosphoribosylglycinamide formyltransferase [Acidobacteriota bacterium]MBV9434814.1 phosphoribosylglycinamide formyltransferase [Acidobacteriota bacterium]
MKLGILLSGRGSNFIAIADNLAAGQIPEAEIAVVISNKPYAAGIEEAQKRGLNAHVIQSKGLSRAEHDAAIVACLREHRVDLVCLAGYMRLISPVFLEAFPNRVLNIHPSLLPAFPGLDAQRQALEYGVRISGCTVHFVDENLDHGVIILQKAVPVLPADDEASLSQRILEQEHVAYTEAIKMVLSGEYEIKDRKYLKKK